MQKLRYLFLVILFFQTIVFLYGRAPTEGSLDRAIDSQAGYMLENIPENSVLAIIGISSGSENLSRYITEGLTSYVMNNNTKNIKIVERVAMPILQKEIDFQYSGAVDDNFMVSLGKMVGANTVIAGTIYSINNDLSFNIRAIEIETSYVLTSNRVDFRADKKLKQLLNGGKVKETLNRDNIPVRQDDGTISKANQELRQNQKDAVQNTVNFFSKDFLNREPRWLIGYNFFPDFPLGIEVGYLRNGLGFYTGLGLDPKFFGNDHNFTYKGEVRGILDYYFGITYPLYFNWLWIGGGGEMCMVEIANRKSDYSGINYFSESVIVVNPSAGIYLGFKRFYITAKYRYLFYSNNSSFMLGIGIGL